MGTEARPSQPVCAKCGGVMHAGVIKRHGGAGAPYDFVIPGAPTSWNPLKAFQQGLAGESMDEVYPLAGLEGRRCSQCGYLELFAPASIMETRPGTPGRQTQEDHESH